MWGTLILVVAFHCATPTGAQIPFGNAQKGVLVTAKEVRASHAPLHVPNVGYAHKTPEFAGCCIGQGRGDVRTIDSDAQICAHLSTFERFTATIVAWWKREF